MYLLTDIYVGYRFADTQMLEEAQAVGNVANRGFEAPASRETVPGPENQQVNGQA
jgi:hypothetical protein